MLSLAISEPIPFETRNGLQAALRRRRRADVRKLPTTAATEVSPAPCYSCATTPHRAGGAK